MVTPVERLMFLNIPQGHGIRERERDHVFCCGRLGELGDHFDFLLDPDRAPTIQLIAEGLVDAMVDESRGRGVE